MADIAVVTTNRVEVIDSIDQTTMVAGAAIAAGQAVMGGSNGTWILADGVTNKAGVHLALRTAKVGEGVTAMRSGRMDGYDLSALAYGANVFLSDTIGAIATTSGTANLVIGRVEAASGQPLGSNPDKILHVLCPI
jgi:hypothetical protein